MWSILPLLCLAASALAAPAQAVQGDTLIIETTIRSIHASLENLADVIKALDSHQKGESFHSHVNMIQHHGMELSQQLAKGAQEVRSGPKVELYESTKLMTPIQSLTTATENTVRAWIAAKQTIINSGGRDTVYRILQNQQRSADEFSDAIVSRIPDSLKYIGQYYGQRVKASVESALKEFR